MVGSVQAIPYTDVYDIFQGGYDGGDFPGVMSGFIKITDLDGDGLISANDPVTGSLIFSRPLGNGFTAVRGFGITSITGSSLLSGAFSITSLNHLGEAATITNISGTAANFGATNQAPAVTMRVPDGGSTAALLGLGLLSLRCSASRRSMLQS